MPKERHFLDFLPSKHIRLRLGSMDGINKEIHNVFVSLGEAIDKDTGSWRIVFAREWLRVPVSKDSLGNDLTETEWSLAMYDEIVSTDWECPNCNCSYNITGLQKLQHKMVCVQSSVQSEPEPATPTTSGQQKPNSKRLDCPVCENTLYLSAIEVLKHRKACTKSVKQEKID